MERYWNGAFWNGGNRNGNGTWNRVPAERYWNGGTVERWNRNGRSGSVGFWFQRCYLNLACGACGAAQSWPGLAVSRRAANRISFIFLYVFPKEQANKTS